jgi:hypothetical protein
MFDPVRQSPARNSSSGRFPTVGVGFAVGKTLRAGLGRAAGELGVAAGVLAG